MTARKRRENETLVEGFVMLPCPFCGGEADWYIATKDAIAQQMLSEPSDSNTVSCDDCGCTTPEYRTKEKAINAWNKRK